jgi:hypothetical protein
MLGRDVGMWQHERMIISAVTKVPRAPSRDPANDLQNYLYYQATFQRTDAIDVKAHLRFYVHVRQLSAQTSAIARSNTKDS